MRISGLGAIVTDPMGILTMREFYVNYDLDGKFYQIGPYSSLCSASGEREDIQSYSRVENCHLVEERDLARIFILSQSGPNEMNRMYKCE